MNFEKRVKEITDNIRDLLIEKNKSYGDAALNPIRIFSKQDSEEQLKVRIDDKLSRLSRGSEYANEDTITDLIGGKAPSAGSFTPAGLTGVNSVRIKPNAQGGTNHQIDFDVKNESNATTSGEDSLLEKPKNLNFPKP